MPMYPELTSGPSWAVTTGAPAVLGENMALRSSTTAVAAWATAALAAASKHDSISNLSWSQHLACAAAVLSMPINTRLMPLIATASIDVQWFSNAILACCCSSS